MGRERLDVSVEERQRRRREESARNRPLNENVIRGSRNKAEKLGEDGEDVEVGGEGGGQLRSGRNNEKKERKREKTELGKSWRSEFFDSSSVSNQ